MSFFTGAGGLDLGFEQAGFQTVYATDIDADSCDTLRLNSGDHLSAGVRIEQGDIVKLDPRTLPKDIDLIIGGPPCQSFSASGRRAGGAAGRLDRRGMLFEAYCKIIEHARPKAFVFENVRGILGTNGGADWAAIVAAFTKLGYKITYRLLDALDYGAPQQRERMFLVGHQLPGDFLFPEPTHGPDSASGNKHRSVGESFEGLSQDEDLEGLRLLGGKYSHLLPEVPPGQNYLYFTAKRGYQRPIFAYRSRFSDFLYKANPNLPVKTIIASPGKYTGPLHWDNRYFSIREYMRIQGFPDDYKFSGGRDDVIRQIGNSVSPKIAHRLALAIAGQVFGRPVEINLLDANRVLSFDSRKGQKARKTRALHQSIGSSRTEEGAYYFKPSPYFARLELVEGIAPRVAATMTASGVSLRVNFGGADKPFAKMVLQVYQSTARGSEAPTIRLNVEGYGEEPATAQAMWNAVDDWVRRCSGFHSLFELYGHFTEPYPAFSIENYSPISEHPVALFAAHASNFANCSRYFPKAHLVNIFSSVLHTSDFGKIAEYLRGYRFDVRSHETNIAIDPKLYMVAYPFNLPARRQMNFRVRERQQDRRAEAV